MKNGSFGRSNIYTKQNVYYYLFFKSSAFLQITACVTRAILENKMGKKIHWSAISSSGDCHSELNMNIKLNH